MDVYALWQQQKERTLLQVKHLTRMVEAGIEAILGPTTAYIAPKNGEPKTMSHKWFHHPGLFKSLIPIRSISGQGAGQETSRPYTTKHHRNLSPEAL